jgi:uncharacterized protein (TIGR00255 family)
MALQSMTGFARVSDALGACTWQWELRSVNGKSLDLRLRLAAGFENLESPARAMIAQSFKRGNIQANLQTSGEDSDQTLVVNEELLKQIVSKARALRKLVKGPALRADSLLGIRGVVDVQSAQADEVTIQQREKRMLASLKLAIDGLARMRAEEGKRTTAVLKSLHDRIKTLVVAASDHPARQPDAIRTRLREQVQRLLEQSSSFDEARLHQEAVLLATRADIQEEIERLRAHLEALDNLLTSDDAVGRKLDFLAQEFNREANTLCSKANDKSLTAIGLDLKVAIDQLREQVQNIE